MRHDRSNLARERALREHEQFLGAFGHVDVRILLVDHDRIRGRDLLRRQVAMQIEFDTDEHARPDDLADAAQQVAFGVGITVRDHRAVQIQQHGVDRQRGGEFAEDFVAQRLIRDTRRVAGRRRKRRETFDDAPPQRPCALAPQ